MYFRSHPQRAAGYLWDGVGQGAHLMSAIRKPEGCDANGWSRPLAVTPDGRYPEVRSASDIRLDLLGTHGECRNHSICDGVSGVVRPRARETIGKTCCLSIIPPTVRAKRPIPARPCTAIAVPHRKRCAISSTKFINAWIDSGIPRSRNQALYSGDESDEWKDRSTAVAVC